MLVVGIAVGIVIFFCVDKDVGIVDRLKVAVALFSHRHKASSLASHKRTHTIRRAKPHCTKSTKSESSRC